MTANIALMQRTLDFIESHPEEWNQKDYRRCFAAHAARLSGATFVVADDADKLHPDYYKVRSSELEPVAVWKYAESALGLEIYPSLFNGFHTLSDLKSLVGQYEHSGREVGI